MDNTTTDVETPATEPTGDVLETPKEPETTPE